MKIMALIPARGGSKRVKNKNVRLVNNLPLISYTIKAAQKSRYIDEVIVSSDRAEIGAKAIFYGAKWLKRPKSLAQDDSTTEQVLLHALRYRDCDYIVLLQPTSPLRTVKHIDEAIRLILKTKADSLVSVVQVPHYYLMGKIVDGRYLPGYTKRPFSHNMVKKYRENGAIFIFKRNAFLKEGDRLCGKTVAYVMNELDSIDIDEPEDFELVERLMKCSLN